MITALQRWVSYKAREDALNLSPTDFNAALERVCFGSWKRSDLELLFEPIKDLFELDPEAEVPYKIYLLEKKNGTVEITPKEMHYIMVPKSKGQLFGKADQSIGRANYINTLKPFLIKAGGSIRKGNPTQVFIPRKSLPEVWRHRLLYTYFNKGMPHKSDGVLICSLCGTEHTFENLRFIPPVNIFVEDYSNFTPYLSGKPAHSICPYCVALMLRACVSENAPQMTPFFGARRLQLLVLPHDPKSEYPYEIFSSKRAEEKLQEELGKTQFDALHFLLSCPLLIADLLPFSQKGLVKPSVYVVLVSRGRAEEIINQFIVTRFDRLARAGRHLTGKDVRFFGERLYNYVLQHGRDQRIHAYRDIFNFVEQMMVNGIIDFNFLKKVLRREISIKKQKNQTIFLYGFGYIRAFLEGVKEIG